MNDKRAPTASCWLTLTELANIYHMSKATVYERIRYIDSEENGRYRGARIRFDHRQPQMINRNVFEDACQNWVGLHDSNLKKHVKPYDPVLVAWQRGEAEGNFKVVKPDMRMIMEAVKEVLREGLGA